METKGKTNKILENILDELECLVVESGLGDLNAFQEIQKRLIFTQTLLSAEISSVKEGEEEKRFELACMAKRLTKVEEAFDNQWTGTINETGSVPLVAESLQEEECQDDSLKEKEDDVALRRNVDRIKRKRFRGLVSFGIVGLVAGMVSFYGYICDQMNENNSVLIPT